ncbi:MAG: glucose-1-phosphate thymidylyltransferase RfbA [Opitutales bacterium]|nr:glucose-1-phosphate thymidylyltransferase RfbA [Opitutales bacterium]MCH8539380.1 glucose-1-phosphate thymidylyltransferase RfbA [Opitutales bacterium]
MNKHRKGILLAGGSGSRLYPLTVHTSKQLMPVYDKPLVYYPLSVLMLAGLKEILLISTPKDLPSYQKLLGDGSTWGLSIEYAEQPSPDGLAQALVIAEDFLAGHPSCLILGDNIFYGHAFTSSLQQANLNEEGATIFGYHVSNPSAYGVVEFSSDGKVVGLVEKPAQPASEYAVPGLYFYDERAPAFAQTLSPSPRGELEITDLNRCYLTEGSLRVELIGRGTAWLDTGTHDSLLDAGNFIQLVEKRQGLKIACLEEIALGKGWIDKNQLSQHVSSLGQSSYRHYLENLLQSPAHFLNQSPS